MGGPRAVVAAVPTRTRLSASLRNGILATGLMFAWGATAFGASLVTSTVNAGGGTSSSANYTLKSSVGEIVGYASATGVSLWGGFIAQVQGAPGNTVPTAAFTVTPSAITLGESVAFTDTSTGTITSRFWIFGDGKSTNTTATSISHTYGTTGSNTVTLIVSGPAGISTNTQPAAVIVNNLPTVTTPTITPAGGTFTNSVLVTLACSTTGSTIYYTTDGSDPTASSTLYNAAFMLNNSATIKAAAFKTGSNPSAIASADFVQFISAAATPTISPVAGTYTNTLQVSVNCTTPGATIRYTTDGSDPTGSSPIYNGAFTLSGSATVKAIAFANGYNTSAIAATSYGIVATQPTVATPAITPAGGTFTNSVQVTLACSTVGAAIRYTTDGTAPTTNSTAYASAFTLNSSATVRVVGYADGANQSSEAAASFTVIIPLPTVATPVFAPAGGTYTSSVQVAISCATPGATIRYTTNGSEPTVSSPVYTGLSLITLNSTTTLKAAGFASGYNASTVATASFTVNLPPTLTILTGNILPAALKGVAYSQTLQATNGTLPYTWSVPRSTKLPAGLKLAPTGLLSGKPSKLGITSLLVTVKDSANHTAQRTFSLTVADPVRTFGALAGTYTGLLIDTNAPTHNSSGALTLVLSKTGSYAANLTMHGSKIAFKGQFDLNGDTTTSAATLGIVLHVDTNGVTKQITGTVTGNGFTSVLVADLNGHCPANLVANYTLAFIPADETDVTKPQGYGYATLSVSRTGLGTLAGALGDGMKLSAKAPVSKDGNWPLYASLYGNNAGSCIGWVTLSTTNATGLVDWFAPTTSGYSAFSTTLDLIGSKFVANQSFAGVKLVTLSGGGLVSNIVKHAVVAANGSVTVTSPGTEALTVTLTLKTGQFKGTFVPPTGGKLSFTGLLLQEQASGAGLFQSAGKTGGITVVPAP